MNAFSPIRTFPVSTPVEYRYKSLLVEPGGALGLLCDYIHVNPVRAGLVEVSQLGRYRHSSYWFMQRPAPCKLAIAAWLKSNRDALTRWIAEALSLGAPAALSRNLTHYRRHLQRADETWQRLTSHSAA